MMKKHLTVALVTAVLQSLIQEEFARLGGSVDVKAGRPIDLKASGADQNSPAIRIYLYQSTPNPSLRNQDLPLRSENGRAVQVPRVALDLHYLIAFYGDEQNWVPQQLLGKVLSLLHSHPQLTSQAIQDAWRVYSGKVDSPFTEEDFLYFSGLARGGESIRLTQTTLNLEELSKLWSILFQVPYALSVTFQASVVFIEEDVTLSQPLPVHERQITTLPFHQPHITDVTSITPQAGDTPGAASNLAASVLQPAIKLEHTSVKSGDALKVAVTPPVGKQQAVFLLLNEDKDTPDARMFRLPAGKIDGLGTELEFDLTGVEPGEYFVRLVVDGAQSALQRDEQSGRFSGPRVIVT